MIEVSGQVDRASATDTIHSGSILGLVKSKTINWYSQLPCLMFSNKRDSVKSPPCGAEGGQMAA